MHAPELVKEFLQRQQRSAQIVTLKAGLGIVQSPMPSGSVTAPRGHVADKRSSLVSGDLGNRGKVPQVLGTSRSD